jgi:hypothetical protein
MSIEVEIEVAPDGTTKIEVNGVQGPSCAVQTDALIRALGGTVVSDQKKPEFYQAAGETVQVKGKEVW